MKTICIFAITLFCTFSALAPRLFAGETIPMKMVSGVDVSPEGDKIAFSWQGEIWLASIDGTNIQRLTNHSANDTQPHFSPDGKQLAFVSNRKGSSQIFLMDVAGGAPVQVTFHSEGYSIEDWYPDGSAILASGSRDHYHRDVTRLLKVHLGGRRTDQVLFDAMAEDARLSPDGKKVLFTREGERWWRKGYTGQRSAQVWQYDLESETFTELLHEGVECMWPQWMSNGRGFYFTKGASHGFELWQYRWPKKGREPKQSKIAGFEDDSIVYPALSRNGRVIVFRHLFDLYSLSLDGNNGPRKIELSISSDVELPEDQMRRTFSSASEVAYTPDGLDIAFIAGGDVWVMDTTLREPRQVTHTAGYENDIIFSADGQSLWFTSIADGKTDIYRATRSRDELYWWQNESFDITAITDDTHVESGLKFTPDGKHLVFQQGRGDLALLNIETQAKRILVRGFSGIDFDISPDSRWLAYAQQDNDFNSEIWIADLAGEMKPVNVSRHPDNDGGPRFSPDGKILAFTGRRVDREVDIYYVYLQNELDQESSRDRRMAEALELMKKKRKSSGGDDTSSKRSEAGVQADRGKDASGADEASKPDESVGKESSSGDATTSLVEIDFDGIHERVRRIPVLDSYESGLLFSPDGKKLAFSASVDGKRGWYTVTFPDELTPKFLTASTGAGAVWSKPAGGILFHRSGVPAKLDVSGKLETYDFSIAQTQSRSDWLRAGFEKAWLTMREVWYDDRFANKNWDEIRRKYADTAALMPDTDGLGEVVELMLGELNGSHLGFTPQGSSSRFSVDGWSDTTAHLGVRFDDTFNGPGLLVRDVIPDGPADRETCRLLAGDIILMIDSVAVDPAMDLTQILNGRLDRDISLTVKRTDAEGDQGERAQEMNVSLRPISYSRARQLLYPKWLDHNRKVVNEASQGKLGYLHIRLMDTASFLDFERELYNVGYGREGIVIDVRDNGGGSTTDLLLTALTQPRHAITVPRGGGQGYPQDRAVFASWSKPIVVLCNQNSYSNAEIFSHAIKTLNRGKVVGVQTAGGVVSTGSASINDVGRIRVPFRGWFLVDSGEDMERNGCEPDVTVWPMPGELPQGVDRQLEKAIEVLSKEVGEGQPDKELIYASERE